MTARRIRALVKNPARIQQLFGILADTPTPDLQFPPPPFDYVVTDLGKVARVPSDYVAAQGTLTATAQPANTDTVTINLRVYTFQAVLVNVNGNVQIGADLAASLANLAAAVNLTGTPGTDYALATVIHPTMRGDATATTVLFTAKTANTAANAFPFSETGATLSTDGGGTIGGTTAGVNGPTGGGGMYVLRAFNGVPGPADIAIYAPVAAAPFMVSVPAGPAATFLAFAHAGVVIATLLDAALTVFLPSAPAGDGDRIIVKDGIGNAGTNAITIDPLANTIEGAASLIIGANFGMAELQFNAALGDWLILNII